MNPKLLPDLSVENALWISFGCVKNIVMLLDDDASSVGISIGIAIFNSFVNDIRNILHENSRALKTHEHKVQLYPIFHWFKHWENVKTRKQKCGNPMFVEDITNRLSFSRIESLDFTQVEDDWLEVRLKQIVKMDAEIGQYTKRLFPLEQAILNSSISEQLFEFLKS